MWDDSKLSYVSMYMLPKILGTNRNEILFTRAIVEYLHKNNSLITLKTDNTFLSSKNGKRILSYLMVCSS